MAKLITLILVTGLAACGGGAVPATSPSSPAESGANGGTGGQGMTGGQTYGAKPAPTTEKSPADPCVTP